MHLHRRRLRPRLRPRRPLRPHLRHRLRLRQCAPCAHMVFTELFEFFVAFFKLRRRVLRIIRPCARSSGVTSSLRPAPPRRHRRRPLLPLRLLQQLRAASASSSSPFFCACNRRGGLLCWSLGDGAWLCILPCTSGIGNTGACPSSPMRSRAWQTRACVARWPDCIDFGIAPSTTASTRRHLRLRRLLHYATTMAPPRAPAASCAATLSSATST